MTILMTFESIKSHLPADDLKAINALVKHYASLQSWQAYYESHPNEAMHSHISATLTKVARELARRLLAAYPAQGGESESMDDVMALERIAGG